MQIQRGRIERKQGRVGKTGIVMREREYKIRENVLERVGI